MDDTKLLKALERHGKPVAKTRTPRTRFTATTRSSSFPNQVNASREWRASRLGAVSTRRT